jgi:hypothetical protein
MDTLSTETRVEFFSDCGFDEELDDLYFFARRRKSPA